MSNVVEQAFVSRGAENLEGKAARTGQRAGMSLAVFVLALRLVTPSPHPHSTPASAPAPTLDICTPIAAEMLETVDSKTAAPGDFFRFQTLNAVTAGARIVIPERTLGYGIVAIASPAGRNSRPGTLVLEPRYLVMPNHSHLGVVIDHNVSGLAKTGESHSAPAYLGAIPIPGLGAAIGIFNYFHNGANIQVRRGEIFTIFASDDPSVERCQSSPSF